jgi:ATP-dependent Clp protease ATP-binding subunit ClpA
MMVGSGQWAVLISSLPTAHCPLLSEEAAMFERYTEKARRVIFFARYEASQFGASEIEPEHILLGIIREDEKQAARFFSRPNAGVESVRKDIEGRAAVRDRIRDEIDLQLSNGAKSALSFAAEESERLGNRHIGTEHLLLGLLREENSIAADVMYERGLRLSDIRQDLARQAKMEQRRADTTQRLPLYTAQPADVGEWWAQELSEACIDAGLFTQDELLAEFAHVAALRQFSADAEALLRTLAAKGLVEPQHMLKLAFDLRDEKKLAEFIEKLPQL